MEALNENSEDTGTPSKTAFWRDSWLPVKGRQKTAFGGFWLPVKVERRIPI